MTNVALNRMAMARLQGTPFLGRVLVVEANDLAFYDCRDSCGCRCGTCPNCLRVVSEVQAQKELAAEQLTAEIGALKAEMERLRDEIRNSVAQSMIDKQGLLDQNARLMAELASANLVIGRYEGALVDAQVTYLFSKGKLSAFIFLFSFLNYRNILAD